MYRQMNTLKAFISNDQIFMYIPGQSPKVANIAKNQMHYDILSKESSITREEFEKDINTNTFEYSLFKTMYLAELEAYQKDLKNEADLNAFEASGY